MYDVEKLLFIDYSSYENKKLIKNFIAGIKPVKKRIKRKEIKKLDVQTLEKIKNGIFRQYGYRIQNIDEYWDDAGNFVFYTASIMTKERVWIGNAYGNDMHELLSKIIIKTYIHITEGGKEDNEKQSNK